MPFTRPSILEQSSILHTGLSYICYPASSSIDLQEQQKPLKMEKERHKIAQSASLSLYGICIFHVCPLCYR